MGEGTGRTGRGKCTEGAGGGSTVGKYVQGEGGVQGESTCVQGEVEFLFTDHEGHSNSAFLNRYPNHSNFAKKWEKPPPKKSLLFVQGP